jgi:N-methylhydantoinase A/oxoprolinase/acetone carboxylase beta subunit
MTARFRLGFDIGGTFTDFVLIDEATGQVALNKCLTTPDDPARGVLDGLAPLLARVGIGGGDLDIAIHATTLITNALIERKGARTALLATAGFRDVIEMGTEVRYDSYDLRMLKPEPLVPRQLRFDVAERTGAAGDVVTPLDEDCVRAIAARLLEAAVESVAVVYLHAFRNPAHERRTGAILAEHLPGVTISLASAVAPEIREYERMSTTAANAYVQPITRRYLDRISEQLAAIGCARPLYVMISSGGIAVAATAKEFPIRMLESGPAAGVLSAIWHGAQIGVDSMVTFDMGGTTAKIGLVKNLEAGRAMLFEAARVARFKKGSGLPVKVPMIELIEIGAGGGSIAAMDGLGLLKVGPRSAGADPGPACYGRGGSEPTVTDANVLLGYYDPASFLGGTMPLDKDAATAAIASHLCGPLAMDVAACARGIFDVVTQNMLAATRVHIAERGEDPRKFYLFAFGGAGPAHAYEIARALRMRGVIVPAGAGAASAAGLVTAPIAFDYARSFVTRLDRAVQAEIVAVFNEMAAEGLGVLAEAGTAPDTPEVAIMHSMDLRHRGQGFEINVRIPAELLAAASMDGIATAFYAAHEEKYGHAHRHLPVELITCRTTVSAAPPALTLRQLPGGGTPEAARKGSRAAFFAEAGGLVDTPVYDRALLAPGSEFPGPAIVEERECTIVAGPSARLRIDAFGMLFLDLHWNIP